VLPDLVDRADAAEAVADEWDELVVAAGRPFCAPGWTLPWWRHVAPRGGRLSIVTARDDDGALVGLAPFFEQRVGPLSQLRFLGIRSSVRHDIVARADRADVAQAFARVLTDGSIRPDVVSLEAAYAQTDWSETLARAMGGTVVREWTMPAPFLHLGADSGRTFEEWFGGHSRNFRQQMRRDGRKLESEGAAFRLTSDVDDLERDVAGFAALHHGRWRGRGGSSALTPRLERALVDVGRRLLPDGRFRLWNLECGGEPIASHLFIEAGGEVSYLLGGFDERWSALRPSLQTILVAIEDAWRRGDRRMDLGAGAHPYKYRFAESEDVIAWSHVVAPGRLSLVARSILGARRRRRELSARMPDRARSTIRAIRRRASGFTGHDEA